MKKQHFSLEKLQNLDKDALLIEVRKVIPDHIEVQLSPEEIKILEVIAETEKLCAENDHKNQKAFHWQGVTNDLVEMKKGRPYRRPLY